MPQVVHGRMSRGVHVLVSLHEGLIYTLFWHAEKINMYYSSAFRSIWICEDVRQMEEHPLYRDRVNKLTVKFDKILDEFEDAISDHERLTRLEAEISLHIDDHGAVCEAREAPDALDVVRHQVELATGVCDPKIKQ